MKLYYSLCVAFWLPIASSDVLAPHSSSLESVSDSSTAKEFDDAALRGTSNGRNLGEQSRVGGGCSAFKKCISKLSCHPWIQKCYNKPRLENQPCSAGYGCKSGLTCEAGTQKCVAPALVNQACHATKPCASGLFCQSGSQKCKEKKDYMETCDVLAVPNSCNNGLVCDSCWFQTTCLYKNGPPRARFEALPDDLEKLLEFDEIAGLNVQNYHPVFDFYSNGCTPAATIGFDGELNPGLETEPCTDPESNCHDSDFMQYSNTYHRYGRTEADGKTYEWHLYSLYFEKDQALGIAKPDDWVEDVKDDAAGHKHDAEAVFIVFVDNVPSYITVSLHGANSLRKQNVKRWDDAPFKEDYGDHPMVSYFKDGFYNTHGLKFANYWDPSWTSNLFWANAENPTGEYVLPPLASWDIFEGEEISNEEMKIEIEEHSYPPKTSDKKCNAYLESMVAMIKEHLGDELPTLTCDTTAPWEA